MVEAVLGADYGFYSSLNPAGGCPLEFGYQLMFLPVYFASPPFWVGVGLFYSLVREILPR